MKGIYLEVFRNETIVKYTDEEGWDWYICSFKKGKPLQLHAGLPDNIDFPVDRNGCILTNNKGGLC